MLQWRPTSGRARTSKLSAHSRYSVFILSISHNSKRWIIDRASLKQARSEDLQYVDSPEHIDFLNIYFANRKAFPVLQPLRDLARFSSRIIPSYCDVGQTLDSASACHRHCYSLLQAILRQELVLRDRPFHRDSRMLLRRRKGRRIPRPHQKCRIRITPHVQSYVHLC